MEYFIPDDIDVNNAAEYVDKIIPLLRKEPPEPKEGRGIVIAAGGYKFQINAWVNINILRYLGCKLPIECWYLGEKERNLAWNKLVEPLGCTCIDAYSFLDKYPHRRLHGWELKPYAIMHSKFAEVLYLDADNVPVKDPTYLFDDQFFIDYGAVFWPDFGRLGPDRLAWKVFGNIPYRSEPEVESGQILINKLKCWQALELTHWYMQNSNNFYFHHVHGDKEVFHLAWRKLDMNYAMPRKGIHALPGVMCQHDFGGDRIFQHRNMAKWSFYDNPRIADFIHEDLCLLLVEELKHLWSPASEELPSKTDKISMKELHGQSFEYERVGYDKRYMILSGDGTFKFGGAGMEMFWTIRNGKMYISGEHGLTAILEKHEKGEWVGRWLIHEKMPIILRPISKHEEIKLKFCNQT